LLHIFTVKDLADETATFEVEYRDALPDTFAEDVEVVLEGQLRADGTFEAATLLTKCGSRYEAAPEDIEGNAG
jgi:cytochrome c-type biogenesis protein CcmE